MDKIKDIFRAVFIKHQFWTLSVIIMLLLLGVWWISSGRLKGEYDKNQAEVQTASDGITATVGKPENTIFNDKTHAGMKAMNAARRREVYLAWREMEERQRREVLVWPEGLSQKFIKEIEKVLQGRPIEEVKPKTDGTDHLVFSLREEYRNEVKGLLPKLAEMINAEWDPQASESRGSRGGGFGGQYGEGQFGGGFGNRSRPSEGGAAGTDDDAKSDKVYAVQWNPADQGGIESTHFDWSDSETLPTTMEILYSMEDYWVLKALMQIIAKTNADDDGHAPLRPELATIREIHSIHIGQAVESNAGQIYVLQAAAVTGEEGAGEIPPPTDIPPPTAGEIPPEGGVGTVPTGPDPAEGRYVDKAYKPLTAAKLKSGVESSDPLEAYLAVAKRMPVRMLVKMDQRKLNKFLVECGNADLMLEVKQVRINPDEPDILTVAGTATRGGENGFGGGGQGRNGAGRAGEGAQTNDNKFPWDVMVEVYGIIYIFNPPSDKRLTAGLESEEIAEFEAAVKQAAVATATTPAAAGDKPATTDDAGAGEAEAGTADEPADDGAAPTEENPPAEESPPADEREKPAKPPMAAEAPRAAGAAAPAG